MAKEEELAQRRWLKLQKLKEHVSKRLRELEEVQYSFILCELHVILKTAILSWLQNDGTRGFSVDHHKEKQLSPTFRPGALVVYVL